MNIEYLRQLRFGSYAVFDFAASFGGMLVLSPLLSKMFLKLGFVVPVKSWLLFTLLIGILAHIMVGTITPMTGEFLDMNGHYILKLVVISATILGVMGIKKVHKSMDNNEKNHI